MVCKIAHCLKITQYVAFKFLAFFTNFCPIKIELSGNYWTAHYLKITEKVSFNIAKLMVKHLNSVARQVNFDRTKIGEKWQS